jgi:hypothetical protein
MYPRRYVTHHLVTENYRDECRVPKISLHPLHFVYLKLICVRRNKAAVNMHHIMYQYSVLYGQFVVFLCIVLTQGDDTL